MSGGQWWAAPLLTSIKGLLFIPLIKYIGQVIPIYLIYLINCYLFYFMNITIIELIGQQKYNNLYPVLLYQPHFLQFSI